MGIEAKSAEFSESSFVVVQVSIEKIEQLRLALLTKSLPGLDQALARGLKEDTIVDGAMLGALIGFITGVVMANVNRGRGGSDTEITTSRLTPNGSDNFGAIAVFTLVGALIGGAADSAR